MHADFCVCVWVHARDNVTRQGCVLSIYTGLDGCGMEGDLWLGARWWDAADVRVGEASQAHMCGAEWFCGGVALVRVGVTVGDERLSVDEARRHNDALALRQ